jgi:F-type H+-transporting ATPase subunit delta
MKITKQARREAKELFRSCLDKGLLDEQRVRQLVSKVAEAKPRGYLAILTHLQRLVRLEVERRTACVESAAVLSAELQADLRNRLNRLYGQGLEISFAQNQALIGGVRIKVGSDVYDGSIQARLNTLAESF